jgi:hypothetical protein
MYEAVAILKALSPGDCSGYFETSKARAKRCVVSDRNCFEGDNIKIKFVSNLQFGSICVTFKDKLLIPCVVEGFRREVDENCALLGYYAADIVNSLPIFRDNLSLPSSSVKNPIRFLTFEDGTDRLSERWVRNYQYLLFYCHSINNCDL